LALVFSEGLLDYFDALNYHSTPKNKKAYTEKLTIYLAEKKDDYGAIEGPCL